MNTVRCVTGPVATRLVRPAAPNETTPFPLSAFVQEGAAAPGRNA